MKKSVPWGPEQGGGELAALALAQNLTFLWPAQGPGAEAVVSAIPCSRAKPLTPGQPLSRLSLPS